MHIYMYVCVWCMCHICVLCILVCDIYVPLLCMSYICNVCVSYMGFSIPCVCECVFMCVHIYLSQCVPGSQRTTWKRLLSLSITLFGLGPQAWQKPSFLDLINLLPVCFSVFQIRCPKQAFILSYCLKWMFAAYGITTISIFFALNTKDANALSSGYFFTVVQYMWFWKRYFLNEPTNTIINWINLISISLLIQKVKYINKVWEAYCLLPYKAVLMSASYKHIMNKGTCHRT